MTITPRDDPVGAAVRRHLQAYPRLLFEPQPSLQQHLDYARRGEWTDRDSGPPRAFHLLYTYLWVIPVTVVAFTAVWTVARPGRCATVGLIGTVVATALNAIPVVRALVPDWVTWTYWPPLSWLTETEAVG